MSDKKFSVVYTGKIVKGAEPKAVLRNLADLFKVDDTKIIRAKFKGAGAVVAKGFTQEKANRYVEVIKKAGAMCVVKEEPSAPTINKAPAAVSSDPPEQVTLDSGEATVLGFELGGTDITLPPFLCSHVSGSESGIYTHRKDITNVAYSEMVMASIYKPVDEAEEYNLLLFTSVHKRSFYVECQMINFADFPEVSGLNVKATVRSFLLHLHRMNPALLFDRRTYQYLTGAAPYVFTRDILFLTTALNTAIETVMPNHVTTEQGSGDLAGAQVCPNCEHERPGAQASCAWCGHAFNEDEDTA
jgi:hypothetical protein